jgi:hypothetical protein
MGTNLDPADKGLFDLLGEILRDFTTFDESDWPNETKEFQLMIWRHIHRPFFDTLNERVSFLCSQAHLLHAMLN